MNINNMLSKCQTIAPNEQIQLLKLYLDTKDKKIKDQLILCNYRLVYKHAKKLSGYTKDISELIQEGIIGLIEAVDKFDISKGVKPSTYFSYWILAYMYRFILNNVGIISIKKDEHEKLFFNLNKYERAANFDDSKINEITKSHNISEKDMNDLDVIKSTKYYFDINQEESPIQINSNNSSPETCVQIKLDYNKLRSKIINDINPKYLKVLDKRIFTDNPETFESISNEMGISKQRVQQIEELLYKKIESLMD